MLSASAYPLLPPPALPDDNRANHELCLPQPVVSTLPQSLIAARFDHSGKTCSDGHGIEVKKHGADDA